MPGLTETEQQIARRVAEGFTNAVIAQDLGVQEQTVKNSLVAIYDKLGVSNRVQLVLAMMKAEAV